MIYIILFSILLLILLKKIFTKNYIQKNYLTPDYNDDTVTYDNKPLHLRALKRKNDASDEFIKYDCRTTIIECDKDSDCQKLCAENGNKRECINGFCAYVYNTDTLCQNGGTPVSYFFKGRFNYLGCICPPTFIGRFCDIPNKMIQYPS